MQPGGPQPYAKLAYVLSLTAHRLRERQYTRGKADDATERALELAKKATELNSLHFFYAQQYAMLLLNDFSFKEAEAELRRGLKLLESIDPAQRAGIERPALAMLEAAVSKDNAEILKHERKQAKMIWEF